MNSLLSRNLISNFKRQPSLFQRCNQTQKRFTSNVNNKVTFYLNGKKVELDGSVADPESSLIEFLRDKEGLKGTKLTCGEGGCGACTVTLSQWDKSVNKFVHRAVNSCLVPLYYVEGMAVTTVEGLGNTRTNSLHPVQERLAKAGGSQCGYCTPGFVMSMYTHLQNNPEPKSADFCKAIDGNLCRCTGYRPIVETVKSFCKDSNDSKYVPHDTSKDPKLPEELKNFQPASLHIKGPRSIWHAPTTLEELLKLRTEHPHAKIVNGSTELGIDIRFKHAKMEHLIAPTYVPELSQLKISNSGIEIGSAVTLTRLYEQLKQEMNNLRPEHKHRERTCHAIMDQLHWFAGTQIRNVASVGGNIVNASPISDLNPVWMAGGAVFKVKSATTERNIPAENFFGKGYKQIDLRPDEVLVSVSMPWNEKNEYIEAYKQSKRREDDIAIVTSAIYVKLDQNRKILSAKLAYGGMAPNTIMAKETQQFLIGQSLTESTFDNAMVKLKNELGLSGDPPGGMAEYRTSLALSFLYKFYVATLSEIAPNEVPAELKSVPHKLFEPEVPKSKIVFDVPKRGTSVGDSEPHLASKKQVTGEALYTTDIPKIDREVQGALVTSARAHALIKSIDASEALKMPGVIGVYDHTHVPGNNLWGDIVHDEEIFASKQVFHYGQPIAVVVAENEHIAKRAAKAVKVEYEELPNPIFSIEDAIKRDSYFPVTRTITDGNLETGFKESDKTIEGDISIGGQEHFYFEPMVSLAAPEDTDMIIYASTQNANKTQKFVASALNIPANRVIVKLNRLGGGFGGKETRNIGYSAIAAVASHHCNRPVRLVLERDLDMTITGGRHPFRGEYKVGFTNEGVVKAVDVKVYNNGGFTHDLSYPVLERAMLFQDSCYKIPNIRVIGKVCKTNMPSHTAFRGFGGPQGHLIAETWMDHMASVLNKPAHEIREKNLYNEGDLTYYKFPVTKNVKASWDECRKQSDFDNRLKAVAEFNKQNKYRKRGISIMPSKYGVGFTVLFLNQGSALIHCYTDGSVLVTHGGTEMGQGLHTKVAQIVATELDIPVNKVHIRETATDKIPNSSATAASMGSDIYGMAALKAARTIKERLAPIREQNPNATWKEIVTKAYLNRVDLSAQGFFQSEHKGFNFDTGKGEPWRYFTLGTACTEVEVDTLTGDWKMLRNDLVVDVGQPINPGIDVGQIEGAFLQGMGWTTIEELAWGDSDHSWVKPQGRLQCAGPGAYKIPSADDVPSDWRITLMKDTPHQKYEVIAVQSSKAIGEPPLLLGVSARFALREAIAAARKQEGLNDYFPLDSPLSSERVRMACADKFTKIAINNDNKAENFKAKGSF